MTQMNEFDRLLSSWLESTGPVGVPDGLVERAIAEAGRRRQARAWVPIVERDFPMQTSLRLGRSPSLGWLLVILLVMALVAGAIAVGAFRRPLPSPFGIAGDGAIAFDTNGDIVVSNADGSGRLALTSGTDTDLSPIYSPDGTHLAFWRKDASSVESLGFMAADGSDLRIVRLPGGASRDQGLGNVAWAPDSRRVAFVVVVPPDTNSGIWTADLGTSAPRRLTPSGSAFGGATWSPDGTRLAFTGGGLVGGLYVMAADGTDQKPLVTGVGDFFQATWQPGGDLIAYVTGQVQHHVHVVKADGSGDRTIAMVEGFDEYSVAWSSDGARLAFLRNTKAVNGDAYNKVVVVNADGSNSVVFDPIAAAGLTDSIVDGGQVVWSPDDTSLAAFVANHAKGTYALVVIDAATGTHATVLPADKNAGLLGWQRQAK